MLPLPVHFPGFLCAPVSPGPAPGMAALFGSSAFFPRPAPCPSGPNRPNPASWGLPVPSSLFYQFPHLHFRHPHTDLRARNPVGRLRLGAECRRLALRPQGWQGQVRNTTDKLAPATKSPTSTVRTSGTSQGFTKSTLGGRDGTWRSVCSVLPTGSSPPLIQAHPDSTHGVQCI